MTFWEIMRNVSQGIMVVPNASLHVEGDLLEKSSGLSHPLNHDASGKFRKEVECVLFNPFQSPSEILLAPPRKFSGATSAPMG